VNIKTDVVDFDADANSVDITTEAV